MGQGPEGQGGGGRIPELISTNEKPKKTGPLSPAGKQDCPSLSKPTHRPERPGKKKKKRKKNHVHPRLVGGSYSESEEATQTLSTSGLLITVLAI